MLIDHGREIAAGTPAELKAQVGEQRIDVIAADGDAFERLQRGARAVASRCCDLHRAAHALDRGAGRRRADLARVAQAVGESGIAVDEIALRRPTLDDAFLALTGVGRGRRGLTRRAPTSDADRGDQEVRRTITDRSDRPT